MQTRDFCFWLQGIFEVGKVTELDAEQTAAIKQHLALVFQHDPSITGVKHGPVEGQQEVHTEGILSGLRRIKYPSLFKVDEPRGVSKEKLLC